MATLKDLLVTGPARILGAVFGTSFVKSGGTSSQFLKADGSVDSTSYEPELPSKTGNGGKVLAVNNGETGLEWVPQSGGGGGGGASALNDLSDVTISSAAEGQMLRYDATNSLWKNTPGPVLPTGTCNDSSSTAKTVTIGGVTELVNGLMIRVINSSTAATSGVTLNVNNLGAKPIRVNYNGSYEDPGALSAWGAGFSYIFLYDGINDRWLMVGRDFCLNNFVNQQGTTTSSWRKILTSYNYSASSNGSISNATNVVYYVTNIDVQPSTGKIAANAFVTRNGTSSQFVKGDGTLGTYVNILTGTTDPDNSQGSNGDIYIKTSA